MINKKSKVVRSLEDIDKLFEIEEEFIEPTAITPNELRKLPPPSQEEVDKYKMPLKRSKLKPISLDFSTDKTSTEIIDKIMCETKKKLLKKKK